LKRNFSVKLIKEVCPSLENSLAASMHFFQWIELPESETLVFTGTKKPENQKYQKTRKPGNQN
jgi:hypothetical protein